uniref:Uncharacterized protein n=1 Tax=Glossina palpalis gambiensis TaxID=67801 RepID=A0A1B0BHZ0_9MUSC
MLPTNTPSVRLYAKFIHYLWKYVFMAVAFWLYTVYSHCSVNGSNDSYDNVDDSKSFLQKKNKTKS